MQPTKVEIWWTSNTQVYLPEKSLKHVDSVTNLIVKQFIWETTAGNCHIHYIAGTVYRSSIQILSVCNLGVGLNSKQRQRQDTDVLSCNLHLLTHGE